jgi:hypothetical protein
MKTISLIIVLLVSVLAAHSQNDYYFASHPSGYLEKWMYFPVERKDAKNNHISSVIRRYGYCALNSDSIKKKLTIFISYYDTSGNMIRCEKRNKKNKLIFTYECQYNKAGKIINYNFKHGHQKARYSETYQFDSLNQVISKKLFNRKGPYLSYVCKYDSNRIRQMQVYKKKCLYQNWVYSYYPDGKNEETRRYNGRGKLKHTWTFACRPEGQNMKKLKDSSMICIKDSHDLQGNRVKVYMQTNEKGKATRNIYIYNPDTVLREGRGYDENDHLLWKSLWEQGGNRIKEYIWYHKKTGKINGTSLYTYNSDQDVIKVLRVTYKKEKVHETHSWTYTYIKKGLCQKYVSTSTGWKKHRWISLNTYTFYND